MVMNGWRRGGEIMHELLWLLGRLRIAARREGDSLLATPFVKERGDDKYVVQQIVAVGQSW